MTNSDAMSLRAVRWQIPALAAMLAACPVMADPILPDWTMATFDGTSAAGGNNYFQMTPLNLSVYEGVEDGADIRTETLVTDTTKNILGVETRVIRDVEYEDGLLVEVAHDWYARDSAGNVWYFGEHVNNFEYDDDDNLIGVDHEGSWIADGVDYFPGIIMYANPMIGDEYYQEFAPDVAFDFAQVNSLTDMVDIPYGSFNDVLNTGEGNLFDGPEVVENKLYAPGVGLVLVQGLDDDGDVEFEIPLKTQRMVPAPGAAGVFCTMLAFGARRRRGG